MLSNHEQTIVDLLGDQFGIDIDHPLVLIEQNLEQIGLDSLDSLDFLHRLRDKYTVSLPKDIENNLGKMTLRQLAGFLEPA